MDSPGEITEPPRRPPLQASSAALISAVLGNDDILREILLRLDFPTCLVRAAAVSKRWLRHASDPAFLQRFRRLHPPRLLGFYLRSSEFGLRFIPLPQPPEMAAVIRRGKFDLGRGAGGVSDCRNGRLIVYLTPDGRRAGQKTVCRPLHPERGASVLPLSHIPARAHDSPILTYYYAPKFLFHDDGGDDVAISTVALVRNGRHAMVQLQDFQSGVWSECRNSDMIQLPGRWDRCQHATLLANGKIYMIYTTQCILGLDVQSMGLFSIKLPNGVEYVEYGANIALSHAEGSGFCLVHVKMFQMSVWRYTTDYSSTGNWELINTISLRQVLGPNADPTWWSQGADVRVAAVGDNADFVFFKIQNKVFYFHISSRTVEKVYELAQDESLYGGVFPFMMVWPPTFPTLNGGHDKDE